MTLFSMAFNSCGGGSTCASSVAVLAIDAQCNVANDLGSYTALQSGDVVSKEEENTTINIFHNQENQKVVCIESGKASIIRGV